MAAFAVLMLLVLCAVPVLLLASARAPVSRARVARFARRQQLDITPGNGNEVIAYLATTRRWRVAGLLTAYGLGLAWLVWQVWQGGDGGTLSLLQLLAGWFIGAVVAEARLARPPRGPARAASLQPRDRKAYLSLPARMCLPTALLISLAIGGLTLLSAIIGRTPDRTTAVGAAAAAVAIYALVWTVGRHVLTRPQTVLPPDRRAADDALRSRSLHVLAGAGAALILYAVIYQLDALRAVWPGIDAQLHGAAVLLTFAAPLWGWFVATAPWSVRHPAPVTG